MEFARSHIGLYRACHGVLRQDSPLTFQERRPSRRCLPFRKMKTLSMAAEPRFVSLKDGRKIAYTEKGVVKEEAKHVVLVLHAMMASRSSGIPNVDPALLEELGVRQVAIDRPGYGRSDPPPGTPRGALRSFAEHDLPQLADALGFGERFHVFTYSQGSAFGYAAARFAPELIGNIAMYAPTGCIHWEGISEEEKKALMVPPAYSFMSAPFVPQFARDFLVTRVLAGADKGEMMRGASNAICAADVEWLKNPTAFEGMVSVMEESVDAPSYGIGISHDMWQRGSLDWGFHPSEIEGRFKGKIHLWYGAEDTLNMPILNRFVKRSAQKVVDVHELPGEGHMSFIYKPHIHRAMLCSLIA